MMKSSSSTFVAAYVLVFIICTFDYVLCHSLAANPVGVASNMMQAGVRATSRQSITKRSINNDGSTAPIRPLGQVLVDDEKLRRQKQYDNAWLEHIVNDRPVLIVRKRSTDQIQSDELINELLHYKNSYNIDKKNSYKHLETDAERRKAPLKSKLHKFIDTIIDEEIAAANIYDAQQQRLATASKVGVPIARRRLLANDKPVQTSDHEQNFGLNKRLVNLASDENLSLNDNVKPLSLNAADSNLLTISNKELGQQSDLRQTATISPAEHARRIHNDGYGILKEATFTTNNHLGEKGVPKFGSDEAF